jgi:hypothetical protein
VPSGSTTSKKPRPRIARSSGASVFFRSPTVNSLLAPVTPTPTPLRTVLSALPARPLARACSRYIRSEKPTLPFLNAGVLTLARLFEIVSMPVCCAFMPVAAM